MANGTLWANIYWIITAHHNHTQTNYLNPKLFKLRTSLYSVMISGRKFTFNLRILPRPVRERAESIINIRPEIPKFRSWTFRAQSWNTSEVESLARKLSPSAFNFWPSICDSHPLPRTSSTRFKYMVSWLSICRAQIIEPATGGKSRTTERRQFFPCEYWI